ncbi:MAG TPA: autotransporter-associated beta strand repeat-containing protein, partial [Verrucomicrobiae bacterium]|nr:autotransporter-associated beta strand repeat-containing protein [Verrucomicrobiae bacterium]
MKILPTCRLVKINLNLFTITVALTGFICLAFTGQAQTLIWNPAKNATHPSDGSGAWQTANDWWNGSANVSGTWSGSNPSGAIFGAGTPGNYAIILSPAVTATNVTFNTSGYALSGSPLTVTAAGGTPGIILASGVTNQIGVVLTNSSGWDFSLAANSMITLGGGFQSGGNPRILGNAPSTSVVNITNGIYIESGTWGINGVTLNVTGSTTIVNGNSRVDIGRITAATVNVGNGAQINANITFPNDNNSNLQISRGQAVTLNVLSNGLVSTVNNGSFAGGSLVVLPDSSSQATLNVLPGATVNVGTGPGGTPGMNSVSLKSIVLLGGNNSTSNTTFSSGASGIVNVSGGTVTALGIQFGSSGGIYTPNPTAQFNLTGGTVYLGSGGINLGSGVTGFTSPMVSLSGGTLAAVASWSSTMPMNITNNVTFQAADANGNSGNIILFGALSGNGGLTKTGGGTLTLSGTNTYTGGTIINAGSLALTSASTGAGAYSVASNSVLNVQVASLGSSLNVSSMTLSNGAILSLNPNTFGNLTAPIFNVSGTLSTAATNIINFNASTLPSGQFPLIKYGSLSGDGFNAFALGAVTFQAGSGGSATLVNDTANQSIDLNLVVSSATPLKWDGTTNGNWDINTTANWQTNAYYTESNGVGPAVTFDDTAHGPNTDIVLNTTVSPAVVVVSNSVLSYNINGSGGIAGTGGLLKDGSGTFTLGGNNTYTGGTTINQGTLTLGPTNNADTAYTVNGGTLNLALTTRNNSLAMTSLTCGSNAPQLSLNLGNLSNIGAPAINVSGNLSLNGNVTVNVTNTPPTGTEVLLQYSGIRSGTGNFVAGSIPAGATIVDNVASRQVQLNYKLGTRVVIPVYNTNEIVVAITTPQEYGAAGDGITDDSAAFQNAINAVYNSGGSGGGVVFVPVGNYAFYNNITIPTGVTLHGDWQDWTKGTNGLVGTTFKVYFGSGQSNGTPFITMSRSSTLKGINIWYSGQDPNNIVSYPYSISANSDCVVENVALVNSYQGIIGSQSHRHIFSTVVGTPLYNGIQVYDIYDIPLQQDIRFSPAAWANSGLTNAPVAGGSYATWMRNNGTAMIMIRDDGEISMDTWISGYNIGILFTNTGNGDPGCTFYSGAITNCAVGIMAQNMPSALGLMFANFTLDDDVAVKRTRTDTDANIQFEHCTLIG